MHDNERVYWVYCEAEARNEVNLPEERPSECMYRGFLSPQKAFLYYCSQKVLAAFRKSEIVKVIEFVQEGLYADPVAVRTWRRNPQGANR